MNKRAILTLALILGVALPHAACRRGKVMAAPPTAGNGVRIELLTARNKGATVEVALMVYNDLGQDVLVNRNQIAAVGADGVDHYRSGKGEMVRISPRAKQKVSFGTNGPGFVNAPGFYVRFDGVYSGGMRVDIQPMAVGQPKTGPGNVNTTFAAPPGSTVAATGMGSYSQPAAPGSSSVQQYQGPRRKLKSPGTKCAAIPMKVKSKEVPDEVALIMDEVFLTELQNAGFEAIGPDDINSMIGFEKVKEAVGCDDATCVAELGNALGVDYLAAGNVAKLEGSMVLTLKLFDVRQTKVLARANKIADGGPSTLPRLIGEAVQELVERSGL
ncbi:MAG: hypothetical protein HY903_10605 [Deltaproteobacteria bacterium]|nr:hypothetical protein [Deltaproteobacteria bacterium]